MNISLGFSESCMTENGNKACIFPFEFDGKTYNACTWDHAKYFGNGKPWCGTVANVKYPKHAESCGPKCPRKFFFSFFYLIHVFLCLNRHSWNQVSRYWNFIKTVEPKQFHQFIGWNLLFTLKEIVCALQFISL